jgi:thioredoxin-related protein
MLRGLIVLNFVFLNLSIWASSINKVKPYSNTELHSKTSIEWLDLETAADRNKEEKKFFFIDIYTDWCGWCKKMDQSTFKDSAVVDYMSEHFYAVKMNAESKDPIAYKEVLYEYKMFNGKGYNELAVNLLSGKMSFPSFVVLSKKEVKIGTLVGFQKPTELLLALKGYVEK